MSSRASWATWARRPFASRFDGFSIGSNDLTQLVLGIDRGSDLLAGLFDERNEAVTRMTQYAVPAEVFTQAVIDGTGAPVPPADAVATCG